MIDLNTKNGIDHKLPKYENLLNNLQSNILKSHARKNVRLVFLQFIGDDNDIKNWIKRLKITSAMDQKVASDQRAEDLKNGKETLHDGGLIQNIYFTHEGYEELGFDPSKLKDGGNRVFNQGMKSNKAKNILNDPPIDEWQREYRNDIDSMILLADDNKDFVENRIIELIESLDNIAQVLAIERGETLPDEKEHFGYVDGISNSKFYKSDLSKASEKNGGTNRWNPLRPLSEVLVPDPFTDEESDNFGSFLVYRKLAQNVEGFENEVVELSKKLTLTPSQKAAGISKAEYAGALAVGRYRNGTPLAISDSASNSAMDLSNNFNYDDEDPGGNKCPFHAHIRKTNPRDESRIIDKIIIPDRFITRRGIPYHVKETPNNKDEKGLLFMCFQSSLRKQFNFIQGTWSNAKRFPLFRGKPGLDPITGQEEDGIVSKGDQSWPKSYNAKEEVDFDFGLFVNMRGGEYFFSPSITFLKQL